MYEWFKLVAWKAATGENLSGVRIPLSPPFTPFRSRCSRRFRCSPAFSPPLQLVGFLFFNLNTFHINTGLVVCVSCPLSFENASKKEIWKGRNSIPASIVKQRTQQLSSSHKQALPLPLTKHCHSRYKSSCCYPLNIGPWLSKRFGLKADRFRP